MLGFINDKTMTKVVHNHCTTFVKKFYIISINEQLTKKQK